MAKEFVSGEKSLAACTEALAINLDNHHNSECDAVACAEIAIHCIQSADCSNLSEFCDTRPHIHIKNFKDLHLSSSRRNYERNPLPAYASVHVKDIHPQTCEFDTSHPFYGKNIVFTGELPINRKAAIQMAVDVGAVVRTAVSRKTDFLVVGTQDIGLVGDDGLSSKEEKAYALIAEGNTQIHIITSDEFFRFMQPEGAKA